MKFASSLVYTYTVLYRIIATASFVIPSPKIIEANFGCSSDEIREIAAIISLDQISADSNRFSFRVNWNLLFSPVTPLNFSITKNSKRMACKVQNVTNHTNVPTIPNNKEGLMYLKKFFFFILNPVASIIGGKHI